MSFSFALVATGAFSSVFLMLKSKNPVHSVFYLVLLFLHCSGLLVLLGLEYFVLLQLLVYVGALAILFLFVVMLLDIPSTEILAHQRGTYPVAGILAFCIVLACGYAVSASSYGAGGTGSAGGAFAGAAVTPITATATRAESYSFWQHYSTYTGTVSSLGRALYGVHADLLIIASLLLLVAMVGAVGLTLKRPVSTPTVDVFAQHNVDFQKVLVQIPGPGSV
uniref:NADH-ubiquinone oxidoreductase chain 6 n=1 Tax=Sphaeropleales sp. YC001 TaxID=1715688 RepID=A0A0N9H924_9CHLO|nr:NADH dehydrogenase subunit 6 [Sphaeropleales sp. YC001]